MKPSYCIFHSCRSARLIHPFTIVEKQRNRIVLRCGAYVGEVMKRNSGTREFHWLDYDAAKTIGNNSLNSLPKVIGTDYVLYEINTGLICFPLAKVEKYLENGRQEDVKYFVIALLSNNVVA